MSAQNTPARATPSNIDDSTARDAAGALPDDRPELNIVAVIPARGGSKGIPRKNLLPVADKPLLLWTIEQVLAMRHRVRCIVSTDDEAIAAIAEGNGAEVPYLRRADLATDTAATEPVIEDLIAYLTAAGERPDAVMLLQATSPVRLPNTLDRMVDEFVASGVDSLVGTVPQTPFLWWDRPGQQPEADYPVDARPLRQELTHEQLRYRETGSCYLTRTEIYEQQHNRIGGKIGIFVMDEVEGSDIDTPVDMAIAEKTLQWLAKEPK